MLSNKTQAIERGKEVLERIKTSKKILIVPDASRVDYDCVGTAIAMKLFLKEFGVEDVRVYLFGKMPKYLADFKNIGKEIEIKYLKEVDLNFYDLIFLVDTNDWDRVLTRDFSKVVSEQNQNKFFNIDHHIGGSIIESIPENVINFQDVCAGKVLYDCLIEPSGIKLTDEISNALYLSLIGDSAVFKYVKEDTFSFAQLLIDNGADHNKISDFYLTLSKGAVDYFNTAVEYTKYFPELKLTSLTITEEIFKIFNEKLGDQWMKDDFAEFYKDNFEAKLEGYDYGITFRFDGDSKGTRISFRTRGSGNTIELLPVLERAGFKVGGHRNAGGGFAKMKPEEAEQKFIDSLRLETLKQ